MRRKIVNPDQTDLLNGVKPSEQEGVVINQEDLPTAKNLDTGNLLALSLDDLNEKFTKLCLEKRRIEYLIIGARRGSDASDLREYESMQAVVEREIADIIKVIDAKSQPDALVGLIKEHAIRSSSV